MFYGTLLLTGTNIVSHVLGFVYRVFLSRLIGAEVMGLYQLVMPVYSVALSLTAVGLTAAVSNLSAQYHALGDRAAAGKVLRRCLGVFLCLFALVAAVVSLFSDPISVYFLGDARTRLGLLLLLPCLLLTGIENLHKHFFYGAGNVAPPAAVELCEQFIRTLSVLGLLVLLLPQGGERTVGIIVAGMCVSEVFSSVTLVILYRRRMAKYGVLSRKPPRPAGLDAAIFRIALPVAATSLLGNLMGSVNAVLIPQRLVHAGMDVSVAMSAFGVLCGMTLPMLAMPTCFIGALGLVLTPKLAQSRALGQAQEVRRLIGRGIFATSALTMPAMALMVVLGPDIGAALFREPTVGQFILPLSAGMLLSCYQSVLAGSLNGLGRQPSAAWSSIACGAVQVGCTWWLMGLPGVGLRGYVAGFVVSSALGVAVNWLLVVRAAGVKFRFFQWCAAPALSAALAGLTTNLLFHTLLDAGLAGGAAVLACLAFGIVLYLVALSAQGVRLSSLASADT